jgi:hypothetical protein
MREPSKRAACLLFDKVVFDKVRRPANYLVTPWLEDAIDKAGYSLRPCAIKSRTCILIFCAGALIWRWLRSQAPHSVRKQIDKPLDHLLIGTIQMLLGDGHQPFCMPGGRFLSDRYMAAAISQTWID